MFPTANVILTTPGPRYMFSPDDSVKYNFMCLIFNHRLYEYAACKGFIVINNFLKDWMRGTNALLHIHSWREQCNVILQHTRYSRYGAVHYSREKYKEFTTTIARVLDCCKNGMPSSSRAWESSNLHVNLLLGNRCAHIYVNDMGDLNSSKIL